jgi:hypothetical protein
LKPSAGCGTAVKAADFMALRIERAVLMGPCERQWDMDLIGSALPPLPDPLPMLRPPHPPPRAMEVFLDRFHRLMQERHGMAVSGIANPMYRN